MFRKSLLVAAFLLTPYFALPNPFGVGEQRDSLTILPDGLGNASIPRSFTANDLVLNASILKQDGPLATFVFEGHVTALQGYAVRPSRSRSHYPNDTLDPPQYRPATVTG
jgi:hypothetical protein